MIVLSRGVNHQLRFKFFQKRQNETIDGKQNPLIGGIGRQGNIDGRPPGRRPAQLLDKTAARVERPPVLMKRDKKDIGIMVKNLLGTVAMVHICVNDGDPPDPIFAPQIFNHDRLIVDIAKTAVAVGHGHGMVARRSDDRKAVFDLFFHIGIADDEGPASRDLVSLSGDGRHIGNTEMNPRNILLRGQAGLVFADLGQIHDPLLEDLIPGVEQPFLPLRMRRRDSPVESGKKQQSCRFHPLTPLNSSIRPGAICALTWNIFPTLLQPRIMLNCSARSMRASRA